MVPRPGGGGAGLVESPHVPRSDSRAAPRRRSRLMDRGWRLGGCWHAALQELPVPEAGQECRFWLVRRDPEGPRLLLQVWEPLPAPRMLDAIREDFLRRFDRGEPLDQPVCHMGFDDKQAWFLQELQGVPFLKVWAAEDPEGRESLVSAVREAMGRSRVPRLLAPEVIGLMRGRILVPRVLGTAPWGHDGLVSLPEPPEGTGADARHRRLWEEAPELVEAAGAPIRGRSQVLTYLKSLMLGLGSPVPMERILLVEGEEGLGQDRLCDWAAAAAETEGIRVAALELQSGEGAGIFLERLVQAAIAGMEADLYAREPAVAKALARRMATFAFLRGGRRPGFAERRLEVEEVEAALAALTFAHGQHPLLIQIRGMELVTPEILDVVRGLVGHSKVPWLLAFRGAGTCHGLKSCLESMRNGPSTATVILDRLEDRFLADLLGDLLGPHDLPAAFVAQATAACLGNPGFLQCLLERALLQGALVREGGRWVAPPGGMAPLEPLDRETQSILAGRLERLEPAAEDLLRALALAEAPLAPAVLGRVLNLDSDGLEEPLRMVVGARLARISEGHYAVADSRVKDMVVGKMGARDQTRTARSLLRALGEEGGRPGLSVRLQACAQDPRAALAQVLAAIEEVLPEPGEARMVVTEALALHPDSRQQARLWEFLSDAWCSGGEGDRLPWEAAGDRPPLERAWEALETALGALGTPGPGAGEEEQAARLHRKRAFLALRLRRFREAHLAIRMAVACLADHPFHAEQARLRLALGRLHMAQGAGDTAARALEEGLQLLNQKEVSAAHRDRVALMLELGKVQADRGQFQHAFATLQAAKRFLEHGGGRSRLAGALRILGKTHLNLGQMEPAHRHLGEALALARSLDDPDLKARCHMDLGMLRSCQQLLAPALSHIDNALRRFQALGARPQAARAMVWKARTLAALGDGVQAEFLLLKASELPQDQATAQERGDMVFLGAEIAGFREAWREARRLYLEAANRFGEAGQVWRERLARLRFIQAETLEAGSRAPESAWVHLERLKGIVEGTGSRWLEMEWNRAHALLLSRAGEGSDCTSEALLAWGTVLALGREMKFPAQVLEAETRSSQLLLARGEALGARSRIQDALPSFQELFSRLPNHQEHYFLERPDIHAFRRAVGEVGLRFILPEKVDPLADWIPTQANLPLASIPGGNP